MSETTIGESGPKVQVAAALAVHTKREFNGDGYGWAVCAEDRQAWPCATVQAIEATVCSACNGETWVVEVEAQCDGREHEHGEGCFVPIQVTCPSCTTLRERQPNPTIDTDEPF